MTRLSCSRSVAVGMRFYIAFRCRRGARLRASGTHPPSKGLQMQSTRRLRNAALVALSAIPFAGFAASGNVFMNGQSIYGQPAAQGAPVRVVDLASTDRLNVSLWRERDSPQRHATVLVDLRRARSEVSRRRPARAGGICRRALRRVRRPQPVEPPMKLRMARVERLRPGMRQ